jgi:hypothetical protein
VKRELVQGLSQSGPDFVGEVSRGSELLARHGLDEGLVLAVDGRLKEALDGEGRPGFGRSELDHRGGSLG